VSGKPRRLQVAMRDSFVVMTTFSTLPRIIQGGMGIAVSDWRLANAVCRAGQLGVVSGTALDTVFVRRLQDGDPGGHLRRALAHFPIAGAAEALLAEWCRPAGRAPGEPYRLLPMYRRTVSDARQLVTVAANFAEIWLAKEGHDRPVGLNLLTKVQLPTLPSLYGAMLADVDVVIMGAGIPREVPGALDALAQHQPAALKLEHDGSAAPEPLPLTFSPAGVGGAALPSLRRPLFFPIVSAASLATTLLRKSNGRVDGFIVEGPTAGGHNAPPRGAMQRNERGEPIYGPRDVVDLEAMRALGVPFWLAGGYGTPEKLTEALAAGASGIQVGTLFAGSDESGIAPALRARLLEAVTSGDADIFTDPLASPTGYPFKRLRTTDAEHGDSILAARERICDLGYLRQPVREADGRVIYRCPAEPIEQFVAKGGDPAATVGRRCLCNGLLADVGLPQHRDSGDEPALLTCGDDLRGIATLAAARGHYSAGEAIRWLEGRAPD
jgi:NAD(P)H-dependent flavin oxidoreductase YrpB (nitropropane dioxygenase family)